MDMFRSAMIDRKESAYLAGWIRNFRSVIQMVSGHESALSAAMYENTSELVAHV